VYKIPHSLSQEVETLVPTPHHGHPRAGTAIGGRPRRSPAPGVFAGAAPPVSSALPGCRIVSVRVRSGHGHRSRGRGGDGELVESGDDGTLRIRRPLGQPPRDSSARLTGRNHCQRLNPARQRTPLVRHTAGGCRLPACGIWTAPPGLIRYALAAGGHFCLHCLSRANGRQCDSRRA
jgi:hypothetical protein